MKTEAKLEQVKKSCTVTKKILRAFSILLLIGVIGCVIGGSVCWAFGDTINVEMKKLEESEKGSFEFSKEDFLSGIIEYDADLETLIDEGKYSTVMVVYCFVGAVYCLILSIVFKILSGIFDIILSNESPFCEAVLKQLKKLFIIICVLILMGSGLGEALVAGLLFWCIYCMFDYGTNLQTEVDETL